MKLKKLFAFTLALAMVLSTIGTVAFAEEDTDIYKIGEDQEYATLEAARLAAKDKDGDGAITYEIHGKVSTGYNDSESIAFIPSDRTNVATINFVGADETAELFIPTKNRAALDGGFNANYGIDVNVTNLICARPDGDWSDNFADGNNHFLMLLSPGTTLTYTNCEFPNGVASNMKGTTIFKVCKFDNQLGARTKQQYALWAYASNVDAAVVEVDGCTFNGSKGVKVYTDNHTAEGGADDSVTITNSEFNITGEPALVSSSYSSVALNENEYTDNGYGIVASENGKATITIDGETPDFVALAPDKWGSVYNVQTIKYAEALIEEAKANPYQPLPEDKIVITYPVAKGGNTYYATVQDAVDDAEAGTTEIQLLPGTIDENVVIYQVEGKNIVVKGSDDVTYTGSFHICGNNRYNAEETVVFDGINFNGADKTAAHDFITSTRREYVGATLVWGVPHNVTVKNCSFVGNYANQTDEEYAGKEVVALRNVGGYNWTVENCTATGLHSFMQASANYKDESKPEKDYVSEISNVTVTSSKSGLNLGTNANYVITDSTFNVKEYAIRVDANSDRNVEFSVTGCDITAENALIVRKADTASKTYHVTVNENKIISSGADIVRDGGNDADTISFNYGYNYWGGDSAVTTGINDSFVVDSYAYYTDEDMTQVGGAAAEVNGTYYETLEDAVKDAQDGDVIDLLENTVTLAGGKQIEIKEDVTIQNGVIDITNTIWTADSVFKVFGGMVDDFVTLTLKDVDVVGDNYSSAFGVIYATEYGKAVIDGCNFDLSNEQFAGGGVLKGNGIAQSAFDVTNSTFNLENPNRIITNATVNLDNVTIDAKVTDETLVVGTTNNHALRNVVGTIQNSTITIDGFETGLKNTENTPLSVTDSSLIIKNTKNEAGNDIYLDKMENLVKDNSMIDAKIYADDTKAIYNTLTFQTDGGEKMDSIIMEENGVVDLSEYIPEREGYRFGGWYADEALTQKVTEVTLDSNKTIYAKWNKKKPASVSGLPGGGGGGISGAQYTVTFETNGGSAVEKLHVKKGDSFACPDAPTKDGFVFAGWYTDENLTEKYDFTAVVEKNLTLYAGWTEATEEPGASDEKTGFTDLDAEAWYYEVVNAAIEAGLMNGMSETEFAPNANLTRGMFVTILYRADGEPAVESESLFADVAADQYYTNAVIWAAANGIVNGVTETTFVPSENITREQMAAIISRYLAYKNIGVADGGEVTYTDDAEIAEYAQDAVKETKWAGLLEGNADGSFAPKRNTTRAEAAALFVRLLNILQ